MNERDGRRWLIALTRLDLHESDEGILARLATRGAHAGLTPERRALARLRDEIAICDSVVADLDSRAGATHGARVDALAHYVDDEAAAPRAPLAAAQDELRRAIDEARVTLLLTLDDPSAAIPLARELRTLLRARIDREETGLAELGRGARMRAAQSTAAAREVGRLAAFWIDA